MHRCDKWGFHANFPVCGKMLNVVQDIFKVFCTHQMLLILYGLMTLTEKNVALSSVVSIKMEIIRAGLMNSDPPENSYIDKKLRVSLI